MRKMIAFAALTISCFSLLAQTSTAPVERPSLTKGDTWKYRTVDNLTGNELRQAEAMYAETENELFIFKTRNLTTNSEDTFKTNADLQVCRTMRNDEKLLCHDVFKFPMAIGNKHKIVKRPWSNATPANEGAGYDEADCEVKAAEKITVPAGTFETLRIECSGYQNRVIGGSYNGSFKESVWYSPLVKRSVKYFYENRGNRGVNTTLTSELVSYKVQ